MAKRKFIFRGGGRELVLPVTPDSYQVESGINVETINIHQLGDVNVAGFGSLATIKISCMFPSTRYPFAAASGTVSYINQFQKWVRERAKLRFIVSGTKVNIPVLLQNFSYGERDGTNDVYADIVLREYKALKAVKTANAPAANASREPAAKTAESSVEQYTIQYGDTLSAICRKYYGDGSAAAYNRLAQINGISNPNLIYAGNTLKIPQPLT